MRAFFRQITGENCVCRPRLKPQSPFQGLEDVQFVQASMRSVEMTSGIESKTHTDTDAEVCLFLVAI